MYVLFSLLTAYNTASRKFHTKPLNILSRMARMAEKSFPPTTR